MSNGILATFDPQFFTQRMKKILLASTLLLLNAVCFSQTSSFRAKLEAQTSLTTPDHLPFWMRSNQFGSIPLSGPSVSVIASGYKDYDTTKVRLVDWGARFEGRANGGKGSNLILVEGYGKVKLGIFELKGGRMRETFGLTDTLLTTGNFAISGNALGIPKVQIAIPEFYAVPVFGRIFAFKGVFAQGWLGEKTIQNKRIDRAVTYFHQKAFYARIGKPNWRLKLYGGFNDQVFWGHEAQIFESFILTGWQKYQSVVLGKSWAFSKVGNHAGNIDVRVEYDFDKFKLGLYRQSFYEVGALYHLANVADGINGVSLVNKTAKAGDLYWKRFVFEFLYSKNQAGETWSKPTPSGNENYLNHYLYQDGWSYYGLSLGTPFITPANHARPGQSSIPINYFINNRIIALHLGSDFIFGKWNAIGKVSYSKNFGTHDTSKTYKPVNQFSGYFDFQRNVGANLTAGGILAFDSGKLLPNSGGILVKIARSF
ncbi:capsule assembly Wzi family protein [Dyadobacter sp. CY323]|uniref:capsule assembly Wzi family protein n=1 Tax=Dyadobacter sp. CY323 TaxID=2907302 RepID=UPI001F373D84|nr:capsule assembly Wzi family protein [Dyadobacter sp. CY323]MCE6992765.1 capsule assembly Wzi family protein [Dyadobacter sp. CY323]